MSKGCSVTMAFVGISWYGHWFDWFRRALTPVFSSQAIRICYYLSCSKKVMKKRLRFFVGCLFLSIQGFSQPLDSSVHRILFLGNSITYSGGYITDIEAWYTRWHPEQTIEFINLGLPSETVSGLSEQGHAGGRFPRPDLHERLSRILKLIKPSVVFASYGMNDGIYLPFDEQKFQQYKNGMNWLHETLAATGARVILVTPPVYDERRGAAKGYAAALDEYAGWLLSQQKSAKWEVVDIHFPMKKYLEAHRKLDASFNMDAFALANDGIHPGEAGHWLMAKQLLIHLGEKKVLKYTGIQPVMATHPNGAGIYSLLAERQDFMKDAWLTETGHLRPEMRTGMPLDEAAVKAADYARRITALQ